ncbi:MAG: hypothetical protein Q7U88_13030 [Desulfocapsaceae bacterium]|nr:hypothetical protein [Desulfocapsaceae bacterium]
MWYSYLSAELDDNDAVVAQVTTDQQSSWYCGHFPDDPILPGIAQLHMVSATIAKVLQKDLILQSLTRIKFKKLIRPGDVLDIHAAPDKKKNQFAFRITSDQEAVCSGTLTLAPKEEIEKNS